MRVAVDIDGVLCDTIRGALDVINDELKTNYQNSDINQWDFPINGVSIGVYLRRLFKNSDFILSLQSIGGAKESLKILSNGHDVTIVTGRPIICMESTKCWVEEKIGCYNIIFTKKKTIKSTNCDVLIDDYSNYLNDFSNSGGKTIQYQQPWNRNFAFKNADFKVLDWDDILELFLSFK
jgi:5'(3')-deoxyribonucleotidase